MPDFSIENNFSGIVAGIDEVGYGSLVGPVVSAIVCFPEKKTLIQGINDSKKISASKREILFKEIVNNSHYAIGIATVKEINEINILEATKLSARRAIKKLKFKIDSIIIDGIHSFNCDIPIYTFKKGDTISISIAAASIIAKVTRDKMMDELHEDNKIYGWNQNKGYGTKKHREAIQIAGATELHRTKFIRAIVINKNNHSATPK